MGLLAYMPLHIFLSTWLGTSFGVLEFAKIFKDIVVVAGFALVLAANCRQPWFKNFLKDKLVWLIVGYTLLTLLLAALKNTDLDAEILGVVYNLRFLLFFLYGGLLAKLFAHENIMARAIKVVLAAGALVLVFGIIQYLWLPNDALTHVGYSRSNGVLPAFFIDDKPDLERVMSTVRDPNSLGSYVIIILSIALSYLLVTKNKNVKQAAGGLVGLGLLCLYFTFSRSAWLGAAVAVLVLGGLLLRQQYKFKLDKKYLAAAAVALIIGMVSLVALRDTYLVENIIFHSDEQTVLEDPNELRLRFWQTSIAAALLQPQGFGPGTAGLASIRNDVQGVVLNENYYLQILYEVGVLGLLLFLAIIALVAKRLYELTDKNINAIALLAALAGLTITNFLVHIWSNEAVSYTFWGLTGLSLFGLTDKESHNKHSE